jgi:apolipoprotein N-acyltransferase
MFVITNDGWWEDTPGYKQHLSFSKLRAIETRRSIARSANTGISAFINQKGEILKSTNWWEQAVIKSKLYLNNKQTFYTKHGDMIGRIASFLAVLMLLYSWVLKYKSNLI